MNKKLASELTRMEDWEFSLLEHHLYLARQVRDAMNRNALDNKAMAPILNVDEKDMPRVLNGSYEFDMKFMALLQAYNQKVAAEKAKYKIEAEDLQFTQYKHQYPVYVNKVEKLCTAVEELLRQNSPIQ